MNRNCTACDIMIDINNYKKDRTVCKTCYNKNKRKNNNDKLPTKKINTSYQHPNIENVNIKNLSTFENRANVIIGPRNVGKTYYMLKVLEKIDNKRPIHIITRSPNQYPIIKQVLISNQ